jgi:nucleoside-specific outer membrane channel protein Tsx
MGAPTPAILMEIFMQYLEYTTVDILRKYKIIDYYRYVDDILIIYNAQTTNINNTLDEFSMIHPKIKFPMEEEQDNTINYSDIAIEKPA